MVPTRTYEGEFTLRDAETEYQRACIERLKSKPQKASVPIAEETAEDRDRLWSLIVQSAKN
jgi:hypothetical protein